jgi:hypothetical protein
VTEPLDEQSRAAVAAALDVASAQGLTVTDPRLVGRGSNRIVWLRPAPVVARVMTGTVVLHDDPRAWLRREIDVGLHLASQGAPIVPPASEVDPGPHLSRGLWVSLWRHVPTQDVAPSADHLGRSLRELHDALASYDGPLPPRSVALEEIDWLLNALQANPEHQAWRDERDRLAPRLEDLDTDPRAQPLHGDTAWSNLLWTADGPRWNDFEDVCIGSPAWDVVGLVDDARDRKGDAYAARVQASYGRTFDPQLTDLVRDAQTLYGTLWRRYARRSPTAPQPAR